MTLPIPSLIKSYIFWKNQKDGLFLKKAPPPDDTGACSLCGGNIEVEYQPGHNGNSPQGNIHYCACYLYLVQIELREVIQTIGSHFQKGKTLGNFEAWGDQNSKRAINTAKSLLETWLSTPISWLYLCGPYGTGKSHLLEVIADKLYPWALYLNATDLESNVFSHTREGNLDLYLDMVSRFPILLLDDLGSEYGSEFAKSALRKIISTRYSDWSEFPTVVTTNIMDRKDLRSFDGRIADRLLDNQAVLKVSLVGVYSYRSHYENR
jgi:DNA replication protein DnaC